MEGNEQMMMGTSLRIKREREGVRAAKTPGALALIKCEERDRLETRDERDTHEGEREREKGGVKRIGKSRIRREQT